ncbi:MAG: transposase [Solirubrobacteraceae bacterium]
MANPYTAEFRREAVDLVRAGESTLPEIARDLGVAEQSLRNWMRAADEEDELQRTDLSDGDRAELRELRRRVRTLETERDVLKQTIALFAKDVELS